MVIGLELAKGLAVASFVRKVIALGIDEHELVRSTRLGRESAHLRQQPLGKSPNRHLLLDRRDELALHAGGARRSEARRLETVLHEQVNE